VYSEELEFKDRASNLQMTLRYVGAGGRVFSRCMKLIKRREVVGMHQ